MALLDLPDSPYWRVWQLIRDRLSADSGLANAGVRIVYLDGTTDPLNDQECYNEASIFVMPNLGAAQWRYEDSHLTQLTVTFLLQLPRADFQDAFNLQFAIESACTSLFRNDFQKALTDAGADTGLVLFNRPAFTTGIPGQNNMLKLQSQLVIDVRRQFSTQDGV